MKKLYLLCISLMPLMICSGMIYSIFSIYLWELGISITQIGIVYTASSISGIIFAPIFGKLSDRVGRKPIIILSIASFSLVFLLYSLSRSFLHILPIQILEGGMWAAFGAVTPAFIADIAKERERGEYMGIYNQAWYTGWAIGPFLGGVLAGSIGFRLSFIICSIVLLIGLFFVMIFVRED
ncbi:MAG: MFS transporter [Halobacteriota archaeon]